VLLRLLTHFGYLAITGLLVAGGVGMPVPEELIQVTVGYLARRGILEFAPALAATYGGIVAGDFLLFLLAQRHGDRLLARPSVSRLLTPKRRASLESHFARHAFLTIVVARHLSGFRVPAYILAATHQVRALTFLLADALSAFLSVPLVVTLGYLFAAQLEELKKRLHELEIALVAAALLLFFLYGWWRRRVRPEVPPQGAGRQAGR
jgi:membrane-associated protein